MHKSYFLCTALCGIALCLAAGSLEGLSDQTTGTVLPGGPTPDPVASPHFPDRLHAYIWRPAPTMLI